MQSKHGSRLVLRNRFVLLSLLLYPEEVRTVRTVELSAVVINLFHRIFDRAARTSSHHKFSLKEALNQSRLLFTNGQKVLPKAWVPSKTPTPRKSTENCDIFDHSYN